MEIYIAETKRIVVEMRSSAHAAFNLQYHFVWSTKMREPVLTEEFGKAVHRELLAACEDYGVVALGLATVPDHVHLLASLAPSHSVAEVVNKLKGRSARISFRKFPDIKATMDSVLWSRGYRAETVGEKNAAQVLSYIQRQEEHHADIAAESSRVDCCHT